GKYFRAVNVKRVAKINESENFIFLHPHQLRVRIGGKEVVQGRGKGQSVEARQLGGGHGEGNRATCLTRQERAELARRTSARYSHPSRQVCYLRANGPRSNLPGSAPVCSLLRNTTSPLTTVAMMPVAFCFKRRAPAGRS